MKKHIGFDAKRIFYNSTGLGNYSRFVVKTLSKYLPENTYTLYSPGKGNVDFPAQKNIQISYPSGNFARFFSSLWRSRLILRQLKNERVELFHGLSNELPINIGKTKIKSIVSVHDLIFMLYPEWYSLSDRFFHQLKVKNAVKNADMIVAVSEQTKKDIVEVLKVKPEKIKVIYQSCHPAFKQTYNDQEKQQIKEKYQLPNSFLLNVGTIEARKNLLTLVKSMQFHELPLVVVGHQTKYTEEVKRYIKENKLESRVQFLENISNKELAIIYQLATIFCYPSYYEGFGIPIIEALYSKIPVITNEKGCFKEAGGPNSFYISCEDSEMLAKHVNVLLENKTLYQESVEKGYAFVQKFNDEVIAKEFINLYQQVLQQSKSN